MQRSCHSIPSFHPCILTSSIVSAHLVFFLLLREGPSVVHAACARRRRRLQVVRSTNIPSSVLSLLPSVRNQRTVRPPELCTSVLLQTQCLQTPTSEWSSDLCLLRSRAALACSSKFFHSPTTNQFQRPAGCKRRSHHSKDPLLCTAA